MEWEREKGRTAGWKDEGRKEGRMKGRKEREKEKNLVYSRSEIGS